MFPVTQEPVDVECTLGVDELCAAGRVMKIQRGAIHENQLQALGVPARRARRLVDRGIWIRPYPQVFAPAGTPDGYDLRAAAACLSAGPGAALSHRSAAFEHGLDGRFGGIVEITSARQVRLPGVVVHRSKEMMPPDVVKSRGLPVTSISRTLIDLCAVIAPARVEIALDSALAQAKAEPAELWRGLNRLGGRGRNGTAAYRLMVSERLGLDRHAESGLETLFHRLARDAGLDGAVKQHTVRDESGAFVARLDFAWPHLRLAVQLHSWRWHSSKKAKRNDAHQLNILTRLGWTVLIFFYEDVACHPTYVSAELAHTVGRLMLEHGQGLSVT